VADDACLPIIRPTDTALRCQSVKEHDPSILLLSPGTGKDLSAALVGKTGHGDGLGLHGSEDRRR
jgi:hypothetical protein